jgi:hypothetical protein
VGRLDGGKTWTPYAPLVLFTSSSARRMAGSHRRVTPGRCGGGSKKKLHSFSLRGFLHDDDGPRPSFRQLSQATMIVGPVHEHTTPEQERRECYEHV